MMKQLSTLLLAAIFALPALAQISKEARIQDSIIGWDPNNYFDRNYKPQTTAVGKQKEMYLNKFADWMKKTYTPVAGLGEYQRFVNANNYLTWFSVWDVDFNHLDAKKKFRPISETGYPRFYMSANQLSGIWGLDFMNKDDWFFTMQPNGVVADTKIDNAEKMKGRDAKICANAAPYITWINDWETVYLAPGNQLPMRLATKGEFLNRALERMDYVEDSLVKEELKKEWRKDEATQANIRKYKKEETDRSRSAIKNYLDKYRNKLNEPAYVNTYQFRWNDFNPNADDMFAEPKSGFLYPVYIIDAATIKKMKDSKPLWIAIGFPYTKSTMGNKYVEAYKAITQNLNFDYIYNYFFDPEKVKGIEYKPMDEAGLKARLDGYRRRNSYDLAGPASDKKLSPGVVFQEDFAGDAAGSEPAAWYYYKAGANPYTVATLKNEKGNWLKLGYGRSIRPKLLKALPANFKMEFDVATDGDFSGNTGGALLLELTNRGLLTNNDVKGAVKDKVSADVKIRIESGNQNDYNNNNFRGMLRVDISNAPEVNEQNFNPGIRAEYALKEFTDKKTKIHLTVEANNGAISIYVNNELVIKPADFKLSYGGTCKLCGVPANLRFDNFLLFNVSNKQDVGIYVSNFKITALQ